MANSYKFKGTALATTSQTTLLSADTNETIIIKSIIVTNNTGNTPTVTLDVTDSSASSTFTILKTKLTLLRNIISHTIILNMYSLKCYHIILKLV